jgi:hypothetical protein
MIWAAPDITTSILTKADFFALYRYVVIDFEVCIADVTSMIKYFPDREDLLAEYAVTLALYDELYKVAH